MYTNARWTFIKPCEWNSDHQKLNETTHRVALTSDFGNKLIDFEVSDNDFKLNYVLPDLDKK